MSIQTMHDWILEKIEISWTIGSASLSVRFRDEHYLILAQGVTDFGVTLEEFWGPSVSILEAIGPEKFGKSTFLSLEMQSGDLLRLEAISIEVKQMWPNDSCRLVDPEISIPTLSEISFEIDWGSRSMRSSLSEFSSKILKRIRLSKHQQLAISNDIHTVYPWLPLGSERRIRIIETKSGDRIEIEESTK